MLTIREKITLAILTNHIIQFNYKKKNGEMGARTGEPYEIRKTKAGSEILIIWDLSRNSWRSFRMETIKGVKILDRKFRNRRQGYQEVS